MSAADFIPAANPKALSVLAAAALRSYGALRGELLLTLPDDKHAAIGALLAGGGSIGIETLVDRRQSSRVLLIGIEREGRRLVLAEVSASTAD